MPPRSSATRSSGSLVAPTLLSERRSVDGHIKAISHARTRGGSDRCTTSKLLRRGRLAIVPTERGRAIDDRDTGRSAEHPDALIPVRSRDAIHQVCTARGTRTQGWLLSSVRTANRWPRLSWLADPEDAMEWCTECGRPTTPPYPCGDCQRLRNSREAALRHPYGLCGSVLLKVPGTGELGVDPDSVTVFESEHQAREHARVCGPFFERVQSRKGEAAFWNVSLEGILNPTPPARGYVGVLTPRRARTGCHECDAAYRRHGDLLEQFERRLERPLPKSQWPARLRELFVLADQIDQSHRKACEECGRSRHRDQPCDCGWIVGRPHSRRVPARPIPPGIYAPPSSRTSRTVGWKPKNTRFCIHGAARKDCAYCGEGALPPANESWRED
jgi:hypothetical protein